MSELTTNVPPIVLFREPGDRIGDGPALPELPELPLLPELPPRWPCAATARL